MKAIEVVHPKLSVSFSTPEKEYTLNIERIGNLIEILDNSQFHEVKYLEIKSFSDSTPTPSIGLESITKVFPNLEEIHSTNCKFFYKYFLPTMDNTSKLNYIVLYNEHITNPKKNSIKIINLIRDFNDAKIEEKVYYHSILNLPNASFKINDDKISLELFLGFLTKEYGRVYIDQPDFLIPASIGKIKEIIITGYFSLDIFPQSDRIKSMIKVKPFAETCEYRIM